MRLGVVLVCDMNGNTQWEYQVIQLLSLQLSVPTCLVSSRGASGSTDYEVCYTKPGVQGSVRCSIDCQHCIASPMVEELDWLLLLHELRSYGNSLSGRNTGRPPKPPKQSPHYLVIGAPSTARGDNLLFQMLVSKGLQTFHHCEYAYLFVVSCVCIR